VSYEEKGVNTRSQGVITTAASISGDEETDNSLMARRRRRRERAQTAYIMNAPTMDGLIQPQTSAIVNMDLSQQQQQQQPVAATAAVEGHQMTLADQRRLLRAAYSLNSVDADDVFYDAVPASHNPAAAYKQL